SPEEVQNSRALRAERSDAFYFWLRKTLGSDYVATQLQQGLDAASDFARERGDTEQAILLMQNAEDVRELGRRLEGDAGFVALSQRHLGYPVKALAFYADWLAEQEAESAQPAEQADDFERKDPAASASTETPAATPQDAEGEAALFSDASAQPAGEEPAAEDEETPAALPAQPNQAPASQPSPEDLQNSRALRAERSDAFYFWLRKTLGNDYEAKQLQQALDTASDFAKESSYTGQSLLLMQNAEDVRELNRQLESDAEFRALSKRRFGYLEKALSLYADWLAEQEAEAAQPDEQDDVLEQEEPADSDIAAPSAAEEASGTDLPPVSDDYDNPNFFDAKEERGQRADAFLRWMKDHSHSSNEAIKILGGLSACSDFASGHGFPNADFLLCSREQAEKIQAKIQNDARFLFSSNQKGRMPAKALALYMEFLSSAPAGAPSAQSPAQAAAEAMGNDDGPESSVQKSVRAAAFALWLESKRSFTSGRADELANAVESCSDFAKSRGMTRQSLLLTNNTEEVTRVLNTLEAYRYSPQKAPIKQFILSLELYRDYLERTKVTAAPAETPAALPNAGEEAKTKQRQKSWDEKETALLIDAFLRVQRGELKNSQAVELVSETLRSRLQKMGFPVDAVTRNQAGISLQLPKIQYILTGKGLTNAGYIFHKICDLYRSDRPAFDALLAEARSEIEGPLSKPSTVEAPAPSEPSNAIPPQDAEEEATSLPDSSEEEETSQTGKTPRFDIKETILLFDANLRVQRGELSSSQANRLIAESLQRRLQKMGCPSYHKRTESGISGQLFRIRQLFIKQTAYTIPQMMQTVFDLWNKNKPQYDALLAEARSEIEGPLSLPAPDEAPTTNAAENSALLRETASAFGTAAPLPNETAEDRALMERFRQVLNTAFKEQGYSGRFRDKKLFEQTYEKLFAEALPGSPEDLQALIERAGIKRDGLVFPPMDEEQKQSLQSAYGDVERLFASGVSAVSLEQLFQRHSQELTAASLFSAENL
ncbi:MAG: hypothetical protein J5556_00790, partial [Deltaproteobacteria bacterium]|nr:hypothetical protein [Deltaproteobacteria bacterium]